MKAILALLLLIPLTLAAQEDDSMVLPSPNAVPEKGEGKSMLPLESQLRSIWFSALSDVKVGQMASAKPEILKMIQTAQRLDIQRLTPFALSLLTQGQESLKNRDILKAQWYYEMAHLLDAKLPETALYGIQLAWAKKNVFALCSSLGRYLYLIVQTAPYGAVFRTNVLILLSLEALILLLFFTFFLFYANLPKLMHDTRELFSQKYATWGVLALSLGVLLLPVVLGLNWFWIAAYLMAVTWGYASAIQRGIALMLLVVIVLLAPALYFVQVRLSESYSPIIRATQALQSRQASYPYIGDLEMLHGILGNDPDLVFLIGTVYQMGDDPSNAMAAYRLAIENNGNQYYARLNLGNLYFSQNNFAAAIPEYQKAQAMAPDFIPAYYNLNKTYMANYEYAKGQEILRTGMAVNARQISRYLSSQKDVITVFLSMDEARALAGRISRSGALKGKGIRGHEVQRAPLEGWANPLTLAAFLGLIGCVVLHARRKSRGGYAGVCTKCGRTFCGKCKSASESQIYCTQCIHIYIKKDGVPLETKVKKMKEVKTYLAQGFILRKVLSALFPGFYLLTQDKTLKGTLIFAVFSALVLFGLRPTLLPLLHFQAPLMGALAQLSLILAAAVWVVTNAKVLLEKGGI